MRDFIGVIRQEARKRLFSFCVCFFPPGLLCKFLTIKINQKENAINMFVGVYAIHDYKRFWLGNTNSFQMCLPAFDIFRFVAAQTSFNTLVGQL